MGRFQQSAAILLERSPSGDWDWLTIMQHHGVPTRLLDWTESALVGLHFAVSSHPDTDGALWVLSPCGLNSASNIRPDFKHFIPSFADKLVDNYKPSTVTAEKVSTLKPIAVIGPRSTPRMQAQLGAFTVMHRDQTALESIDGGRHVHKILIPKEAKATLHDDLRLLGIGEFQLFPELMSIGRLLSKSVGAL